MALGKILGKVLGNVGGQEKRTAESRNLLWKPQQEAMGRLLTRAEDLYGRGLGQDYQQAIAQERQRLLGGTSLSGMAQQNLRGLLGQQGQLARTARGEYLDPTSKAYQDMYKMRTQPMVDRFQQVVAPGIDSKFAMAGRLGSGAFARARNTAEQTLAEQMRNVATQMSDTERNRMMQAQQQLAGLGQQATAMQGATTRRLGQLDPSTLDAQRLAQYKQFISGNMGSRAQRDFYGPNRATRQFGAGLQLAGMVGKLGGFGGFGG